MGRLQPKVTVANRTREIRPSGMTTGASGNVDHGGNVNPPRNRKGGAGNPPPTVARARDLSRPFGTGFAAMRRGKKREGGISDRACLGESNQRCRLDQHAKLRNSTLGHEQRGQTEHEAIERGQIRRALPGSIADQKLMFEQKRLCGDGAYTAWASRVAKVTRRWIARMTSSRMGRRTMTPSAHKTAQHGRIASRYEFAADRSTTSYERCSVAPS
jgi:hypothetical protein